MRGIILGGLPDDDTGDESYHHRPGYPSPVGHIEEIENGERSDCDEHGAQIHTETKRTEKLFHRRPLPGADGKDAYYGEDNPHGRYQHGSEYGLHLYFGIEHEGSRTERGGSEDGTAVAFIEVCPHTCHIPHVVAHIVGYRRRITRVVLRDSRLDLSHEVGAHIGRLGIDTAAHTREKGLCGGTHTESQHRRGHHHEFLRPLHIDEMVQHDIPQ